MENLSVRPGSRGLEVSSGLGWVGKVAGSQAEVGGDAPAVPVLAVAYGAVDVVAFTTKPHETHVDAGFFRDAGNPFTLGSLAGPEGRAAEVRFGGENIVELEAVAPKGGALYGQPVGSVVAIEIISYLGLVLGLPIHVRENLDGGVFRGAATESKDGDDRSYDDEEDWYEVSHPVSRSVP